MLEKYRHSDGFALKMMFKSNAIKKNQILAAVLDLPAKGQ
jgi:hypothetical protein